MMCAMMDGAAAAAPSTRPIITPETNIVTTEFSGRFSGLLKTFHDCVGDAELQGRASENLFVKACRHAGLDAELAPKGQRGWDLLLQSQRVSLKTQADKKIRDEWVRLSKLMELGDKAVRWGCDPTDLEELRRLFLNSLQDFDRFLILRCFRGPFQYQYELLELPKSVFAMVETGAMKFVEDSDLDPKSASCTVTDVHGLLCELGFDGGGEQKIQLRRMRTAACLRHGEWVIPVDPNYA